MNQSQIEQKRFSSLLFKRSLKPSKGRIILAETINFTMLVIAIISSALILFDRDISNTGEAVLIMALGFIAYFIFNYIIFLKLGWPSFGHFVTRLILVDGSNGMKLDAFDIIGLWFKRVVLRFKYVSLYDVIYFFGSDNNQSKTDEVLGVFTVCRLRYHKMIKKGDLIMPNYQ